MPVLDWIGKKAVVNHHREVPYRLVHCDGELSAGDPDAGNLLVQGDNLGALKALLPYYAGKVKCIYIDPPYNTGNEGWVYNDNVNSPEIKAWLEKTVGKEGEDLSRHDKWLCMMYPRLRLLREFLREDGAIFVSIDDDENHRLRVLLDEIFGSQNFIASLIWQKKYAPAGDAKYFSDDHDYVLVYGKHKSRWVPNKLARTEEQNARYSNPDNDPRGPWKADNYASNKNNTERPNGWYPVLNPNSGEEVWPSSTAVWRYPKSTFDNHVAENRIWWGVTGNNRVPAFKRFLSEVGGIVPRTVMLHGDVGHTQFAKRQILEIFHGQDEIFATPKPSTLIQRLLEIGSNPDDLILDSFAGSGTTGHAVLDLNKQDGGNRKFILVEMDQKIAPDVTAERLKRVIHGYDKGGDPDKPVEGLGGGFRYCRLGVPLFNEFGDIDAEVNFPDLAAHVFFAETGAPIPQKANTNSPFLGTHQDKAVYLLFSQAMQGFAREADGNVLTPQVLADLPAPPEGFDGKRIVYAEGCTVSEDTLKEANISFKQIPYQIEGGA
ncbi:site-specific DNA-methyltransferase [Hirschia baltica]|uniref:site-specific DNA-methyltransferase (adenine-specific) n=1 Tax=Hirschia baltica (strain ATCC 49814 / DSM 5838 / IFAM 1418) TaxID=582402 RepID=C6XJM8_HIRBI|nr:site-specific DNA-methyltransferase [Hirschia baltica]ACT59323.1 Site-specific DNA-methyltransferase (adenine-specific) [Hirschia baltica ATCC 49814]